MAPPTLYDQSCSWLVTSSSVVLLSSWMDQSVSSPFLSYSGRGPSSRSKSLSVSQSLLSNPRGGWGHTCRGQLKVIGDLGQQLPPWAAVVVMVAALLPVGAAFVLGPCVVFLLRVGLVRLCLVLAHIVGLVLFLGAVLLSSRLNRAAPRCLRICWRCP